MTLPMRARCPRRHTLVRYAPVECEQGHEHREFTCPMRRGTKPCGLVVISPPYGPSCWKGQNERGQP